MKAFIEALQANNEEKIRSLLADPSSADPGNDEFGPKELKYLINIIFFIVSG